MICGLVCLASRPHLPAVVNRYLSKRQGSPDFTCCRQLPAVLSILLALTLLPILNGAVGATSYRSAPVTIQETDTGAVRDGGFDRFASDPSARSSPWRFRSRQINRAAEVEGADGANAAVRLCGVPRCEDELTQVIEPPAADGALLLTFSLRVETAKRAGAACQDTFLVQVALGDDPPTTVGRSCEEVAVAEGFVQHRIDLTAIAAQADRADAPLQIGFVGLTTGASASTVYSMDDVALLQANAPPGPDNIQVSSGGFSAYSEPHVAVDPEDPDRLVGASKFFTDNSRYRFRVGVFASANGGRTWTEQGILSGLEEFVVTSDPVVAFGPDGQVYVAVIATTGIEGEEEGAQGSEGQQPRNASEEGGWGVFTYRSDDGGRTFKDPVEVDIGAFDDKEWLAVDLSQSPHRGNVYVVWQDSCVTYFSRSTDGGQTFSPRQELLAACAGAQVAVGPDGAIYVLGPTYTLNPELARFRLTVSRDGGRTFDEPRAVLDVAVMPDELNGGFRSAALPSLAVAPDTGDLVVAWNDDRGGNVNVWLSRSTDGGATFSDPIHVNDIARGDQFQPAVAVGANGTVIVSWFDRRADPQNRLAEVYVARSVDGGRTFGPGVRVGTQRFDPALAAPPAPSGNLFFGDYQGLTVAGGTVIPFWNDPRTGLQQIWSARLPLEELPSRPERGAEQQACCQPAVRIQWQWSRMTS